jgi:hypothetical protein
MIRIACDFEDLPVPDMDEGATVVVARTAECRHNNFTGRMDALCG